MLGEKPLKFKFSAAESRLIFRETAPEDRALSEDEERRLTDLGFDFVPGSSEDTEKAKEAFSEKMHLLDPQVKRFIIAEGYSADQFADLMVTIGYEGESEYQKNVEAYDKQVSDLKTQVGAKEKELESAKTKRDDEEDPAEKAKLGLLVMNLERDVKELKGKLEQVESAKPEQLAKLAAADRKLLKDRIYVAKKTFDIGSFVNVLISKATVLDRSRVPSSKEVLNSRRNPYLKHLYRSPLPAHARNFSSVVEGPGFVTLKFKEQQSKFTDPEGLYQDIDRGVDHYLAKGEILDDLHPNVKAALRAHGDSLRNPVPVIGPMIDYFSDSSFSEEKVRLFNLTQKQPIKEVPDYTIDGYAYVALVWPMMEGPLRHELRGQRIPSRIVDHALSNPEEFYDFNNFVLDFAKHYKDGRINQDLLKKASIELKDAYNRLALGTLLAPTVLQDGKTRPSVEELRERHYQAKYNPEVGMISRSEMKGHIDNKIVINTLKTQVLENPENWNPGNPMGLARIRAAWENLGIPVNEKPYNQIFNQLVKIYDGDYHNKHEKLDGDWMQHPDLYREQIMGALGEEGEDFFVAWEKYKSIKEFIQSQHHATLISTKSIEELGGAEYADKVLDFGKKNVQKLMSAVKEGDWGTVAVYGAGVWALYQVFKNKTDNAAVKFVKDYAPWVALGYFGVKAAEAAGYEPLKAIGLKDKYAELLGTNLHDWLDAANVPELQNLDARVFATTAKMNMKQMYEAGQNSYLETSSEAPGWIDPAQFDYWRPKFSGLYGKLGQKFKQNPEYQHVGKELYRTIKGMQSLYEQTVMVQKGGPYYGVSFEKALSDPRLKKLTVEEFLGAIIEHSKGKKMEKGASAGIQKRFEEVLEGKQMAPNISMVEKIKEGDVAAGTLMGLPVAVQHRGDQYVIYYMPEYRKGETTGGTRIELGRIPVSGKMSNGEVEALKASVKTRFKMAYNEARLSKGLPKMDEVSWDGMKWSFEEEYSEDRKKAFDKWGVSTEKGKMSVSISNTGELVPEKLDTLEGRLLDKIAGDQRFAFLSPFKRVRPELISLTDVKVKRVEGGHEVATAKLKIIDLELPIYYDGQDVRLQKPYLKEDFKAPQFRAALKEIVRKDKAYDLDGKMATLREKIANADPDWWSHIRNLGGDSLVLNGPISKRKAEMLMALLYAKLEGRIDNAFDSYPRLKDLIRDPDNRELSFGYMLDNTVKAMGSDLDQAIRVLGNHGEVKAGEFESMVTGPLTASGFQSNVVKDQFSALVKHDYEKSWGVRTSDAFGADFHKDLQKRLDAYAALVVDDHVYTYKDGDKFKHAVIKLDELKNIPATTADPKDPEWRGWYALEYNREIAETVKNGHKPSKDFETWAAERGILKHAALDKLRRYSHEGSDRTFDGLLKPKDMSELERKIAKSLSMKIMEMEGEYSDVIVPGKLRVVLEKGYAPGMDVKKIGYLVAFSVDGNRNSKLWNFADGIAKHPRHMQDKFISSEVERIIVQELHANPTRYFKPGVDFSTWLKMKFPILIKTFGP